MDLGATILHLDDAWLNSKLLVVVLFLITPKWIAVASLCMFHYTQQELTGPRMFTEEQIKWIRI